MSTAGNINATLKKIAGLPYYTEGPAIDNEGNFYCTTLAGGSILKVDTKGNLSEWAHCPCPNGQIILPNGDHLVCDSKQGLVLRFGADGEFAGNASQELCAGVKVYVPNDLVVDAAGNLYFTDSIRHKGKVCFIGTDGREAILAADLDYPNGLIFSADEQYLYVAESYQNRIIKIEIKKPGVAAGPFTVFARLPAHASGREQDNLPDGLALNINGDIGVAHYGMQSVCMLTPEGKVRGSIDTTMPFTSNLIFTDEQTLLVTGGYGEPGPGGLFKIQL